MVMFVFALILSILSYTNALYESSDDVVILNSNSFKNKVIADDGIWLVEFYAPWCGHCKNLAPEIKKASSALKGIVKIGVVDCDTEKSLCSEYSIQGFPTIKIFGSNKMKPVDYKSGRSAQAIVDVLMEKMSKLVKKRLNPAAKEESNDSSDKQGSDGEGKVIELTESNFEKNVFNSGHTWMVEFFAPWCGHCKRLKPEYDSAAKQLGGTVKLGAVDATVHQSLAGKYNVQGYPTIMVFSPGKKEPEPYEGGRTASDIVNFMKNKAASNRPAPKPVELVSQESFDEACKDMQLCIVSVLPDLLDCQSDCRKNYIKMLEKVGEKYKANHWAYLWTSAGTQQDLESTLNMGGFGYPAMVAINVKKQKYAPLRGSFSLEGIQEFLRDVSLGSRSIALFDIKAMPKIVKAEKWDGKDAKPPVEDEIPLDEL